MVAKRDTSRALASFAVHAYGRPAAPRVPARAGRAPAQKTTVVIFRSEIQGSSAGENAERLPESCENSGAQAANSREDARAAMRGEAPGPARRAAHAPARR